MWRRVSSSNKMTVSSIVQWRFEIYNILWHSFKRQLQLLLGETWDKDVRPGLCWDDKVDDGGGDFGVSMNGGISAVLMQPEVAGDKRNAFDDKDKLQR